MATITTRIAWEKSSEERMIDAKIRKIVDILKYDLKKSPEEIRKELDYLETACQPDPSDTNPGQHLKRTIVFLNNYLEGTFSQANQKKARKKKEKKKIIDPNQAFLKQRKTKAAELFKQKMERRILRAQAAADIAQAAANIPSIDRDNCDGNCNSCPIESKCLKLDRFLLTDL